MNITANIGKVVLNAKLTEVETVIWGIVATLLTLLTGSRILF